MSEEKQIKEMAEVLRKCSCVYTDCEQECSCCKNEELYDDTLLHIAQTLCEAGYRKQEWISVEERLPEKNVRVLVYIKSSRSYTRFDTDRLDDRGWVRWFNDVTHWMPLPEAPKMRKEDEGK